ncbi:hypothetical protein ACOSP7_024132 [Xanthoceras sorbifolium]
MRSSFPAKATAAAVVLVYLFAYTSASALLLNGDLRVLSLVSDRGSSSRKAFPGKEGSFGCEYLALSGNKKVPFRVLRSIPIRSPPAPGANQRSSFGSNSPPPQIL